MSLLAFPVPYRPAASTPTTTGTTPPTTTTKDRYVVLPSLRQMPGAQVRNTRTGCSPLRSALWRRLRFTALPDYVPLMASWELMFTAKEKAKVEMKEPPYPMKFPKPFKYIPPITFPSRLPVFRRPAARSTATTGTIPPVNRNPTPAARQPADKVPARPFLRKRSSVPLSSAKHLTRRTQRGWLVPAI